MVPLTDKKSGSQIGHGLQEQAVKLSRRQPAINLSCKMKKQTKSKDPLQCKKVFPAQALNAT